MILTTNICFGPMCNAINNAASGSSGNSGFAGLMGSVIAKFVNYAIIIAGILLLFYLLWAGLDWIASKGEKERLIKAQLKITHAVIGLLIVVITYTLFGFLAGNILGVVKKAADGSWVISIPSLFP